MAITHTSWLSIIVDAQAPITINAQIAEQIKLLIAIGDLQPGDVLPTVTQLAEHLGVNHNTIAAVYNYLIKSDYLVAQRGKGTFVANTQAVQDIIIHNEFYKLLGQAFNVALRIGLSPSELAGAAYAQAVRLNQHNTVTFKLVFVEYSQHSAYVNVYEAIQSEVRFSLLFVCMENLKAKEPAALKELQAADLVITTVPHQWEVLQLTAPEQEVIAVNLKPDLQLLTQISSLPRHAKVLLVCQDQIGSRQMKWMLESSAISHVSFTTLDLEGLQQNPQVLSQFDMVCVSRLIENYVRQCSLQLEKVVVFNFRIDESNMSVLKARLAAIQGVA